MNTTAENSCTVASLPLNPYIITVNMVSNKNNHTCTHVWKVQLQFRSQCGMFASKSVFTSNSIECPKSMGVDIYPPPPSPPNHPVFTLSKWCSMRTPHLPQFLGIEVLTNIPHTSLLGGGGRGTFHYLLFQNCFVLLAQTRLWKVRSSTRDRLCQVTRKLKS